MDFPQNNIQPINTSDFPQNYNQPMTPNNGYSQNFSNNNNYPQYNNQPKISNDSYNQNQNICVNNHHINNHGYFYIMPNAFMNLQSQQKIIINANKNGFSPIRFAVMIFFLFFFLLEEF